MDTRLIQSETAEDVVFKAETGDIGVIMRCDDQELSRFFSIGKMEDIVREANIVAMGKHPKCNALKLEK